MLIVAPVLLAALQAVQIEGTVRDSTARLPIAGVVVQLLDSSGLTRDRGITNLEGRYRVASPAPVSRLLFLRMGYRPRSLDLAGWRDTTADVTMTRIPTMLEGVRAVGNRLCPRRRDSENAFALWQQARTGLIETVVAREQLRARFGVALYDRLYDRQGERIRFQKVRLHQEGNRAVAFHAAHGARDFMRLGFVERAEDGIRRVYYGPDAETLLHQDFQAGYCFSIADLERGRPGQMGLRFTAARRLNDRVDLDGVLWIDTVARAMVDIQWRYVGMEAGATRYRPGGSAMFEMLPNGLTVLSRWSIRGVGYRVDSTLAHLSLRQGAPTPTLPRIYTVSESGGELLRARFDDGTQWRAILGSLSLGLHDRRGRPVVGRVIRPDSTDYVAVTDSSGEAVIEDLIPGPYRVDLRDTTLVTLRASANDTLWFEAERGVVVDTALAVETAEMLIEPFCGARALRDSAFHRIILGRVASTGNKPVSYVEWAFRDDVTQISGNADKNGIFAICLTPAMTQRVASLRSAQPMLELNFWDRVEGTARGVPRVAQIPLSAGKLTVFHYTWLPLSLQPRR